LLGEDGLIVILPDIGILWRKSIGAGRPLGYLVALILAWRVG
jgi:hypothetical protein